MINIYYIENAENLQLTLRYKNREIQRLLELSGAEDYNYAVPFNPFKFYLKVSATNTGSETGGDNYTGSEWDYIILEPADMNGFGKDTERYRYCAVSFDGVKIDYANTKVELYLFFNSEGGGIIFDENEAAARFTLFDINIPKKKLNPKKFNLG